MTLDEFILRWSSELEVFEVLLKKYADIRDNSAATAEEKQMAIRKADVFDAKLDLLKYILSEAKKIEPPKSKMREFL